jgi:TatD DNase family protein
MTVQLIDIGVNLTHRSFQSDHEAVIHRAVAAGVGRLVNTGTTVRGRPGHYGGHAGADS